MLPALLLVLGLLLAGCGGPPAVKPAPEVPADPELALAGELERLGDALGAAALLEQIAARTSDPGRRGAYLVRAADDFLRGGDRDGARRTLAAAAPLPLGTDPRLLHRLLQADLLMEENRASEALSLLLAPPPADAARELRVRYHRATAQAFRLLGNVLESARELQALDALLPDPQQRFDNQVEIVRTLAVLSEPALTRLQPSPPGVEGGWMQLAIVLKHALRAPQAAAGELALWRERFPDHPALPGLLEGLLARHQALLTQANRIAVLLPESGRFGQVAAALRDGIVAAWLADADATRPELHFYDASDPAALWPTLTEAVTDGNELVIGPLDKESVTQLARAGELPVPVLALNQVDTDVAPPSTLFQFALSPEDEARQVAERAWLEGLRRPAVLAVDDAWGSRIVDAFVARWQALGGTVAEQTLYDAETADHSEAIRGMLHLEASAARHQELQRVLGQRLEFEPRRRQDIDFVFLVTKPRQARLLRPQLQFHRAADLPVFATSHAWQGEISAQEAPDLEGLNLPDMPWLLIEDPQDPLARQRLRELLPAAGGPYGRLYAMGMDAYQLLPHLARLQSSTFETLDGYTGHLYVDGLNQVHRQLVWVKLGAEPEVLGYSPRLDAVTATDADAATSAVGPTAGAAPVVEVPTSGSTVP
jgi:outer membrane PBP1 activator LpoA protein